MHFTDKLRAAQRSNNSLLCVGLDPDVRKLPKILSGHPNPQLEFNRRIIEATQDLVCAYKLNIAFYESAGERGYRNVHKTLAAVPKGIVTIGDGKRGDIGTTADHQAMLLLDDWKFDASTVSPYMGKDSVAPFIRRPEQGAFILAVTSNEGSKDFQHLKSGGRPLYEHVVLKAKKWNTLKNIGLVVGATRPAELKRIRAMAPGMPLLIPGIGAQQGDLRSTIRYGCDVRGELAVINVGRSILYASEKADFAEKARAAALAMRDEMNAIREEFRAR
jgi:orotidine-5'-phosphate decarboxylase